MGCIVPIIERGVQIFSFPFLYAIFLTMIENEDTDVFCEGLVFAYGRVPNFDRGEVKNSTLGKNTSKADVKEGKIDFIGPS